jgi:hypothetical protein
MKPVQFFYGLMDLDATDGLASVQIDFNEENYEKGPEKTFSELDWIETQTLLDNGTIEVDGTVDDKSRYDDRIKEIDSQVSAVKN